MHHRRIFWTWRSQGLRNRLVTARSGMGNIRCPAIQLLRCCSEGTQTARARVHFLEKVIERGHSNEGVGDKDRSGCVMQLHVKRHHSPSVATQLCPVSSTYSYRTASDSLPRAKHWSCWSERSAAWLKHTARVSPASSPPRRSVLLLPVLQRTPPLPDVH